VIKLSADAPHSLALLRARCKRPADSRGLGLEAAGRAAERDRRAGDAKGPGFSIA
jgi:hypothetical protein